MSADNWFIVANIYFAANMIIYKSYFMATLMGVISLCASVYFKVSV